MGKTILKGDPYYNPNLTLLREDFSLAPKSFKVRPLSVLFEIYYTRLDLQGAYPEVAEGKYQRLIDWAAEPGITRDSARYLLRPYHSWYVENASEKVKPLATLLELYNIDSALQKAFPEVLTGHYERLIEWATQIVTTSNVEVDTAYASLQPYRKWYENYRS